jgi:uncharacterized repeat protein (TIGR03943 family)
VTREVGSVLLILVGGAVLRISVTDVFLRYVKPDLRPWLIVSALVLLVLGAWGVIDVVREARDEARDDDPAAGAGPDEAGAAAGAGPDERTAPAGHGGPDHAGHHHAPGHAGPRTAWLLVLPVAAIFLVAPPALGAFTAERQGTVVAAPAGGLEDPFPPLPAGDYSSRAVWDAGATLEGRTVSLTGFVSAAPDGGWYLTRLALSCCAADAYAIKVKVLGVEGRPADDTWVTVTGTWVPGGGVESPDAIPWLQAASLAGTIEPVQPYE